MDPLYFVLALAGGIGLIILVLGWAGRRFTQNRTYGQAMMEKARQRAELAEKSSMEVQPVAQPIARPGFGAPARSSLPGPQLEHRNPSTEELESLSRDQELGRELVNRYNRFQDWPLRRADDLDLVLRKWFLNQEDAPETRAEVLRLLSAVFVQLAQQRLNATPVVHGKSENPLWGLQLPAPAALSTWWPQRMAEVALEQGHTQAFAPLFVRMENETEAP